MVRLALLWVGNGRKANVHYTTASTETSLSLLPEPHLILTGPQAC